MEYPQPGRYRDVSSGQSTAADGAAVAGRLKAAQGHNDKRRLFQRGLAVLGQPPLYGIRY